jgi:Fe-S cluster assembly protein SufB
VLERRFKAYRHWQTMTESDWAHLRHPPIDFQGVSYYPVSKRKSDGPKSLDEIDPEPLETYDKPGIPLDEQKALAGVAVFDSVSGVSYGLLMPDLRQGRADHRLNRGCRGRREEPFPPG